MGKNKNATQESDKHVKKYPMGHRMDTIRNMGCILIVVVSFVFYFIYDFVIIPSIPYMKGWPLVLFFLMADALLCRFLFWGTEKLRSINYYLVYPDRLVGVMGNKATDYYWVDFSEAIYDRFQLGAYCPVGFVVNGKKLKLNQYTDNVYGLALVILEHIQPYANIEPELMEKVDAMTALRNVKLP